MDKHVINNQLDAWLQGIYSEIEFWNKYIGERGWKYKNKWEITIDSKRRFVLENDIPEECRGSEYSFIDVGSGPFSRCGFITDKVKLNHCAVDPLAEAYKMLKNRYGVNNGINLRTGFVELLDKEFEPNTFDLVHMSNSLDHSFDAVMGIYQLVRICKIGGKVILRHKQNEAFNGKYEGLHQWNLYVDLNSNMFTVWRADERYIINKILSDYAVIKCLEDPIEPDLFYRVEIIKKKDVVIPQNDIYEKMLLKIYNYMLFVIANDVFKEVNSPKTIFIENNIKALNDIQKNELEELFHNNGWNNVAIYGLGKLGIELYNLFDETDIKVVKAIDEREVEYRGIKTIRPSIIDDWNNVDIVIVTVFSGVGQIKSNLRYYGYNGKVATIETILEVL